MAISFWKLSGNTDFILRNQEAAVQTDAAEVAAEPQLWENNLLMEDNNSNLVFRSEIKRKEVRTVTFLDSLEEKPQQAQDVSYHEDGTVFAWLTPREDEYYDLVVAAEGGINAKYACRKLFHGYYNLTQIAFNDAFHTDWADQMDLMFEYCHSLEELDLSTFETSDVKTMERMFVRCTSLKHLDLSSFDTTAVTNMSKMFEDCSSLEKLDVSSFDTSSVTNVSCMFASCTSLKGIYVSHFNFENVTDMSRFSDVPLWESGTERKLAASDLKATKGSDDRFGDVMVLDKPIENCSSITVSGHPRVHDKLYVRTLSGNWIYVGGYSDKTNLNFGYPLSFDAYYYLGDYCTLKDAVVVENIKFASKKESPGGETGANAWENNLLMDDSSPAYSGQAIDESYVLGSKILRKQVRTITFQDTMSGKPNDAFDVSYNDDGSVMAWFNKYSDDQYDLIIAAEGGINARYASRRLFMGYTKLTQITFNDAFHTEQAKSMRGMFESCYFLEELDLSSFDTAAVMDMSSMFSGCESLKNVDVSSFNTASVTDMRYMFSECSELKEVNVSSFDTSKVTDMSYMFHGCKALKHVDISRFDTSKVTNFSQFSDAPLWEFGTEKKINASALKATFGSNTPNGAYNGAYVLKKPVKNCTSITLPRNYQALIQVHTLDGRWVRIGHNHSGGRTIRFAVPLSFDAYRHVPEITSATVVEGYTPYISQETGPAAPGGNTSANAWENNLLMAGNNTQSVFGSENRKSNIRTVTFLDSLDGKQENAWDVSYHKDGSVLAWYTRREDKFYDLYVAAEGGINAKYACKNLFKDYIHLKQITFNDALHTEQAEQMDSMFEKCRSLAKLDLSTIDTSAAKSMRRMFVNCNYLEELDLSSFDTSAVTDMGSMFEGCSLMKKLNISSFDTSSVTDISYMFKDCYPQSGLDLSQFDIQKVTDLTGFSNVETWGETKPTANTLEVTKEMLPEGDRFEWAYVLKEPIKNCAGITLMSTPTQRFSDVYVHTLDGRWIRVGRKEPNRQPKFHFVFPVSFDAYYSDSKIIIADVYADADTDDQPEPAAAAAPDDTHFTVSEKDNVLTITAKDLHITVKDDKEVTITLSGLDLKEEYVTNQASSEKNYLEYGWEVRMSDGKTSYEVGTYSWAFDPGKEETVKLDNISPCFYVLQGSKFDIAYMDGMTMSHTADSITWKYKMTPGYIFDFRNATEFTVSVTDSPANIHDWHTYTRK